jgi:uncharacterized protein (TIGR02266 family)
MSSAKQAVPGPQTQAPELEVRAEAHITDRGHAAPEQRRQNPRFRVELDVTLGSDHNFYAGLTENLSAGGVFVATHLVKSIGESIELSIRVPETQELIEATGVVRWTRDYNESSDVSPGMGIQFVHVDPAANEIIHGFLSRRDPLLFDDD